MRFVLVRPRDPNNVGAAARVMANFGFDDLVVVEPWEPTWREARSAVGASHVLERARSVATLDEAIADRAFVAMTTAAARRRLVAPGTPAAVLAAMAETGIATTAAAVVFGNEKHGLSASELARANAVIVVPTDARQPSMNLAQAVAVVSWEVARFIGFPGRPVPVPARRERPATHAEIERVLDTMTAGARAARLPRPRAARDRLRRLLLRGGATAADVQLLLGIVNWPSDNE